MSFEGIGKLGGAHQRFPGRYRVGARCAESVSDSVLFCLAQKALARRPAWPLATIYVSAVVGAVNLEDDFLQWAYIAR